MVMRAPTEEILTIRPFLAAPHSGQGRLDHRGGAEEVRAEQARNRLVLALLDRCGVPIADVVHQHVDAVETLFRCRHGCVDA
jgi:hypothetical protein